MVNLTELHNGICGMGTALNLSLQLYILSEMISPKIVVNLT